MSEKENRKAGERQGGGGRKEGEREILGKLIFIVIYLVTLLLPIESKGMRF